VRDRVIRTFAVLAVVCGALATTRSGDGMLDARGEAYYAKLDATVAKYGWSCVWVGDDAKSGYAYTVGLSGKHLPELLIDTSDDESASCTMLNVVAKKLIARRAAAPDRDDPVPDRYEPLGPKVVRLLRIYPKEFLQKCVFAGIWAKRHDTLSDYIGMQIVFPDKNGNFPE
jgi:hypothetical protein